MLDAFRWGAFGAFAAAASAVVLLNVAWTLRARRLRLEGRAGPSRVPAVAGLLGLLGALVCPSLCGWWLLPLTIVVDPATWSLLTALVSHRARS